MSTTDGWILLLEDDPGTSDAYAAVLETRGHRVVCVHGGFEAMCRLELEPGPPALLVLDLEMPGIDGFDFYRRKPRMRGCSTAPVIVVSASDQVGRVRFGEDVKAVLRKPVDPGAFLAAVDGCVPAVTPPAGPSR